MTDNFGSVKKYTDLFKNRLQCKLFYCFRRQYGSTVLLIRLLFVCNAHATKKGMESDQIRTDPVVEADDEIFEACLVAAESNLIDETVGYFGPDSVAWQVFREPVILLGGYRAIMLQVAHPAVGTGSRAKQLV